MQDLFSDIFEENSSRWFFDAQFQIAGAFMTLILSNQDVEKLLTMRECIEVLPRRSWHERGPVCPAPWRAASERRRP